MGNRYIDMKIRDLHKLDSYIWDESIVNCPHCGARTEFIELADDKQQHKCLCCDYEFFVEFE